VQSAGRKEEAMVLTTEMALLLTLMGIALVLFAYFYTIFLR
jgi:hypothetical protein